MNGDRLGEVLPTELAFFNAMHGVPRFGVFAPFPCPNAEIEGWCFLIPWAVQALGNVAGRTVLVLPPTHPGLLLLLDQMDVHVVTTIEVSLPLLATFRARVTTVSASDLPGSRVDAVVALSVAGRAELKTALPVIEGLGHAHGLARVLGWGDDAGWVIER